MASLPQILVLGLGNVLRRDEGFGVHAIRRLAETHVPSANVTLLDGGTAGVLLLDAVVRCDRLVLIDAARMGLPPGTLARLAESDLSIAPKAKQSAHDWDFAEILWHARLLGREPSVVVIAAEPEDMDGWSDELTPLLASRLPAALVDVVAAVESAGGRLDSLRARETHGDPEADSQLRSGVGRSCSGYWFTKESKRSI